MFFKSCIFCCFFFFPFITFSQISYEKSVSLKKNTVISDIAYKLPYRGDNFKFYGTFSFHIYGRAFVNNRVYNAFTEAQYISEKNIPNVKFRILKASMKKNERLNPKNQRLCGNKIVFMTPMKKCEQAVKYYYRTGLFRFFYVFDNSGTAKRAKNLKIDFDATAVLLKNLDDTGRLFGIKIKAVTIKRAFIKHLINTPAGKELEKRNIRFVKYLSKKMNRKYEELFLVEFSLL